ncbi:MAG: hypothetical protein IPL88_17030 [Rhizobiales bacterium]|nr:hypothetical protein [Hyphomicrobiales bacterium]
MSLAARRAADPPLTPAQALAFLRRPGVALALGLALLAAFHAGKAMLVWRTGQFFDTDDAMRLQQVRDLMAGQSWGDLTQHRMSPPGGVAMHWSRVVDAPLAALIGLLTPLLGAEAAERATRLVFPFALAAAWLALLAALARRMTDARGGLAAILLGLTLVATTAQFAPGRIDHHGPQIALLVGMALACVSALDPARARIAAFAGAAAALSLAISVENVPFIAATGAIFGLALLRSREQGRAAIWFGLSLAGSAALAYAAFGVGGNAQACDAFSRFHLTAAIGGGLTLAAAGYAGLRVVHPLARLAVGAAGATLLVAALVTHYPACLGDPLAKLPDELKTMWLAHVSEARPLAVVLFKRPDLALPLAAPILLGLTAALWAALSADGVARGRWLALALLIAAGLAATTWQIRASASTLPLAIVGGVAASLAVADRLKHVERPLARLAPVAVALPFASLFWLAVIPEPARDGAPAAGAACLAPAAYAGLAREPAQTVVSSVDAGSFILVHTAHRPLAGAYHRNLRGNLAAIEALLAEPDRARDVMTAAGATLVALCPDLVDVQIYAETAPMGLAAQLLRGVVPVWLERVPAEGPTSIYRMR